MGGPHDFGNDRAWDLEGKGNGRGAEQAATASISTPTSARPLLLLDTEIAANTWQPGREQWLAMVSLSIVSFMVSLDATILVTVLPSIAESLHASAAQAFWIGTSYLLVSAVCQPVIASVSQHLGRQQLLIASIVLFAFGTAFCALAHDVAVMLVGRCVQGLGGGGVVTITQVVFSDLVPSRERPKYFSIVLGSWAIGSIVGPMVGGALVERASWRWCFHVNFPFCAISLVATCVFIHPGRVSTAPLAEKLGRVDWVGAVLFVSGLTSFLVGLSWGGVQYPWTSPATKGPIAAGMVGVAVFLAWQIYRGENSLLPLTLFRSVSSVAAFCCALVNGLVLCTALYCVPIYSMAVQGSSPMRAGIDLLPAVCFLVPGSAVAGGLISYFGRFRWAIWCGWGVTALAAGLFHLFDSRTTFAVFAVVLALFGAGNGMVLTGVNTATQAIASRADRAMAGGMYSFMRSLGMAIGVALSGTVFQNAMASALAEFGLPVSIARDSERYIAVLQTMAETDATRLAILEAYTKGFHAVATVMTAFSAGALLFSLFIRSHSME